jgi:hypothetical protein
MMILVMKNAALHSSRSVHVHPLTIALVGVVLLKIALLVFNSNIYGYANNFDFVRLQACEGVWPEYDSKPKTAANPSAPIQTYLFDGDKIADLCVPTIDWIFLKIPLLIKNPGDKLDIREVALARYVALALCLMLTIVAYHQTNSRDQFFEAWLGIAALLLFGDLYTELYFNTLYSEFSVVFGLFFTAVGIIFPRSPAAGMRWSFVFIFLGSFCLVLSKQQYAPLGLLPGIVVAYACLWHKRYLGFAGALIAVVMFVAAIYWKDNQGYMDTIKFAQKTDTFLGAVLPEVRNLERSLAILGLPDSCKRAVGKNWYTQGMQQSHECPEIKNTLRLKLIPLFVSEPNAFFNPLNNVIGPSQDWQLSYLGKSQSHDRMQSWSYEINSLSSLSTLISILPGSWYFGLVIVSIISSIFLTLPGIFVRLPFSRRESRQFLAIFILGGCLSLYSILSSVFGDGYFEAAKHGVGIGVGLIFQLSALMAVPIGYLIGRRISGSA